MAKRTLANYLFRPISISIEEGRTWHGALPRWLNFIEYQAAMRGAYRRQSFDDAALAWGGYGAFLKVGAVDLERLAEPVEIRAGPGVIRANAALQRFGRLGKIEQAFFFL